MQSVSSRIWTRVAVCVCVCVIALSFQIARRMKQGTTHQHINYHNTTNSIGYHSWLELFQLCDIHTTNQHDPKFYKTSDSPLHGQSAGAIEYSDCIWLFNCVQTNDWCLIELSVINSNTWKHLILLTDAKLIC